MRNEKQAIGDRQEAINLIHRFQDAVVAEFEKGSEIAGTSDLVVFILDQRDDLGRAVAEATGAVFQAASVVVSSMSRIGAIELLEGIGKEGSFFQLRGQESNTSISSRLEDPIPSDQFWGVCFTRNSIHKFRVAKRSVGRFGLGLPGKQQGK